MTGDAATPDVAFSLVSQSASLSSPDIGKEATGSSERLACKVHLVGRMNANPHDVILSGARLILTIVWSLEGQPSKRMGTAFETPKMPPWRILRSWPPETSATDADG